jgi:hypothetical protein
MTEEARVIRHAHIDKFIAAALKYLGAIISHRLGMKTGLAEGFIQPVHAARIIVYLFGNRLFVDEFLKLCLVHHDLSSGLIFDSAPINGFKKAANTGAVLPLLCFRPR